VGGVKVVNMIDLKSLNFSVIDLLEAEDWLMNCSDSLQLQITHSHITIAATNARFD
jgi:hypothetical protein